MDPGSPLLQVSGLTVAYGRVEAVKAATFAVGGGEVVALLGSPGAGRSSLVLTLAGVLRPRAGAVVFAGRAVTGRGPNALARLGLSHPLSQRIFDEVTIEENLRRAAAQRVPGSGGLGGASRGVVGDVDRWLRDFSRLGARRRSLARTLDPGAQAQLALARGLMARPRLLVLDEPFAALDATGVRETTAALRAAAAEGLGVLYTDRSPPTVPGLADRTLRLEGGRVAAG